MVCEITCNGWDEIKDGLREAERRLGREGETLWFRGAGNHAHSLSPSLMWLTQGLTSGDHDKFEQDAFFEFQARAAELRRLNLTDWEYLFFARHYRLPTRVMDWTDTFAMSLYFATEAWPEASSVQPAIWVINPYSLNQATRRQREIILPKYLGLGEDGEFWDYGELLATDGDWPWASPVSIYPIQINERVRAQRGWFTVHGSDRRALDEQLPELLVKLRLGEGCRTEVREILSLAGLNRFSIYPDLENLALWIRAERMAWASGRKPRRRS